MPKINLSKIEETQPTFEGSRKSAQINNKVYRRNSELPNSGSLKERSHTCRLTDSKMHKIRLAEAKKNAMILEAETKRQEEVLNQEANRKLASYRKAAKQKTLSR